MKDKENSREKKNTVAEAMLRAHQKELQQMGGDTDDQPGLTQEEHEEIYQKIVARLQAEGLMDENGERTEKAASFRADQKEQNPPAAEEGVEEDTSALGRGRRKTSRGKIVRFRSRAAKAACICLVAGAAVFGLSMTGEANRLLLMQTVNTVLGTGDLMNVNNDEDRELSAGSEDEARQEIETALQAEIPDFYYLPEGMTFTGYQLLPEIGYGILEYTCDTGFFYLKISNSISDMSQGNIKETDTAQKEEIETLNGKLEVAIRKLEEGKEQYEAVWEYRNVGYSMGGEISTEEIKKILQNISYEM